MRATTETFVISEANQKEIDHWLTKYPKDQKRSAVIAALLLVQKQNNHWLSDAAMNAVAAYLDLPPIAVYEVATFYDMYHLQPIGKHKISICTSISCMLLGAEKIADCAKKRLGIGFNETTADGVFTLSEMECMAACGGAPMCQVDDEAYHENLTEEKILALIDTLKKETNTHAA
jgi:NADH-quinone oxidoreductase subunit E